MIKNYKKLINVTVNIIKIIIRENQNRFMIKISYKIYDFTQVFIFNNDILLEYYWALQTFNKSKKNNYLYIFYQSISEQQRIILKNINKTKRIRIGRRWITIKRRK